MGGQRTFASMAWNGKGKVTRRERFLAEMDAVIPWARLIALIEPHYPKAGQGRQPLGLEEMRRVYFLQQWFNLSDPQAEDAIYDSESMRRFARVELGDDVVPDETTISPPAGAAWTDPSDLQFDHRPAGRTAAVAALGNHRGRDHHRGAEFDQECQPQPRPRDETDPQGPQLAFRDEAAHRSGPAWYSPYGESDRCQRSRHHPAA